MAFEADAIFRSKKPSAEGYEAETVTLAGTLHSLSQPSGEAEKDAADRAERPSPRQREAEVAVLIFDCLMRDPSTASGAVVEIEPTTQEHELAKHGAERSVILRGDSGMLLNV